MKFSYMLHNKDGRGRRVPRGQAWQWVHDLENMDHLAPILMDASACGGGPIEPLECLPRPY